MTSLPPDNSTVLVDTNVTGVHYSQQLPPFVGEEIPELAKIIFIVLGFFLLLSGTFGNLLVVVTLLKCPAVQSIHYLYVGNLAVADLIIEAYSSPFMTYDLLLGYHPVVNQAHCIFNGFLVVTCYVSSLLTLASISFNRYMHVCKHSLYKRYVTRRLTILMCVMVWVVSLSVSVAPLLGWGRYGYDIKTHYCGYDRTASISYTALISVGTIALPAAAVCYFNMSIFRYVNSANKKLGRWKNTAAQTSGEENVVQESTGISDHEDDDGDDDTMSDDDNPQTDTLNVQTTCKSSIMDLSQKVVPSPQSVASNLRPDQDLNENRERNEGTVLSKQGHLLTRSDLSKSHSDQEPSTSSTFSIFRTDQQLISGNSVSSGGAVQSGGRCNQEDNELSEHSQDVNNKTSDYHSGQSSGHRTQPSGRWARDNSADHDVIKTCHFSDSNIPSSELSGTKRGTLVHVKSIETDRDNDETTHPPSTIRGAELKKILATHTSNCDDSRSMFPQHGLFSRHSSQPTLTSNAPANQEPHSGIPKKTVNKRSVPKPTKDASVSSHCLTVPSPMLSEGSLKLRPNSLQLIQSHYCQRKNFLSDRVRRNSNERHLQTSTSVRSSSVSNTTSSEGMDNNKGTHRIRHPRKSKRNRPDSRSFKRPVSNKEMNMIKTLFIVFVCLSVFMSPYMVTVVVDRTNQWSALVHCTCSYLAVVNNTLNWMLYGLLNRSFRAGYRQVLTSIFNRKRRHVIK